VLKNLNREFRRRTKIHVSFGTKAAAIMGARARQLSIDVGR
jgi:hypothetical protein